MPPEEFFTGTTQAGRVLRLFYEHTAYDTFTGETVDDPSETSITATLDGAAIAVDAVSWNGDAATVRSGDLGTFTATNTDYAEDHHQALRRHLEHRPSEGWTVTLLDKRADGDHWCYTVTITKGRLSERAEFRLSEQVMHTLARGGPAPPNDGSTRSPSRCAGIGGDAITHRAENPTTLIWIAHPRPAGLARV